VPLNAGYEAGAEDAATCGELLAEARALQTARYDLDGKARRAIALEELECPSGRREKSFRQRESLGRVTADDQGAAEDAAAPASAC